MITFKQFLTEDVIKSERVGMLHLQNMKPLEFVDWIQSLHSEFGGVLDELEVSLKVDGLGARFGKDGAGRFFFEGSHTGPVFNEKAFSEYAKKNRSKQEGIDRAYHYDNIFDVLKSSSLVKLLPNGVKVVCEIFYNPMGSEDEAGVSFVTVKYEKSKLGKLMTIVPIDVLNAETGERYDDADEVIRKLLKASTAEIKVVDPKLKVGRIDIRAKTKPILKFGDEERRIIKSLKSADKPEKAALLQTIQKAKDELAEYLLTHDAVQGKDKLGKNIEGLVFTAGGQPVKVTTSEFKAARKAAS